jgi:hypothetical protein
MPTLTFPLEAGGPIVNFLVSVSGPREDAPRHNGMAVPASVLVQGLIDTGASCTCLDPSVVERLQLSPTGVVAVHTPSTRGVPSLHRQFDVKLALPYPGVNFCVNGLPVMESHLLASRIQALIGRDVLAHLVLN